MEITVHFLSESPEHGVVLTPRATQALLGVLARTPSQVQRSKLSSIPMAFFDFKGRTYYWNPGVVFVEDETLGIIFVWECGLIDSMSKAVHPQWDSTRAKDLIQVLETRQ
jgi:hypothetical protein